MKNATAVVLILIGLAGAVLVSMLWRASTASDEPRLSDEERAFVQKALSILNNQIEMDQLAAMRAHFSPLREFARAAERDHQDMLLQLQGILRDSVPDLTPPQSNGRSSLEMLYGPAFDQEYLQAFIRNHEHARTAIQEGSAVDEYPPLERFIALWSGMVNRHMTDARRHVMSLPDLASNMTLLLILGSTSIAIAAGLSLRGFRSTERIVVVSYRRRPR
jgi:predicted outer membrane protein